MANMRAFVTDGNKSAAVKQISRPNVGPGEVLVKIHYAAQNPTDCKAMGGPPGAPPPPADRILGCDFAGTIENPGTSGWKVGQRVAGFVQGGSTNGTEANPIRGAFSEFIPIEETLVFAVPESIDLKDAAAVPLAFATAVQALYQRISLPGPATPSTTSPWLFVYGGATSVGKYAIQLGKLSGFRVITTASPKNHDELKSLGADEVLDYHDEAWPDKLHQATDGQLQHAFECTGGYDVTVKIAKSISRNGGDICVLKPLNPDVKAEIAAANPKVKAQSTAIYTVFERPIIFNRFGFDNCGAETPEDKAFYQKYLPLLTQFLSEGSVKPNKVKVVGTLQDILTGFKAWQEGKISSEKLVYKVIK